MDSNKKFKKKISAIAVLKKLNFDGTLEIIDSNEKIYKFGSSNPQVRIRLKNKSIERKLFFNPNLYIGEAYMNEELIIEKGTIEEFLNLITNCYEDFISNNKFCLLYTSPSPRDRTRSRMPSSA